MSNKTTAPGDQADRYELHKIWWLYLPVPFFFFRYAIGRFTNAQTGLESWFRHELGVIENLTVVFLVVALFYTVRLIVVYTDSMDLLLKTFLVLYCLGCIYFAGEEASWGQHWFGWQTGGFFQGINDQNETNFHNTAEWLDRIPKGIVSLLIFIGGIVIPVLFYYKSLKIDYQGRFWWMYPTLVCTPTAIFATVATWPSKIERHTGWHFYFEQAQETKEFYIALFILLFVVSLSRRMPLASNRAGDVSANSNV